MLLIRFFCGFILVLISVTPFCGHTQSNDCCESIMQMIELESLQILNADVRCPALVAQNYLCRAESYLLIGDFDRAHEDFQQGCLYATQCDDELKKSLLVRGHFGLAIV